MNESTINESNENKPNENKPNENRPNENRPEGPDPLTAAAARAMIGADYARDALSVSHASGPIGQSTSQVTQPRTRRTLQSGFSLMSRGEPKIWLTGGTLVVCLAMIVGLLSMIIINGLSTFWPGPVHWLVLNDQQLDIGEPQRREVRADSKAGDIDQASYFYRTANFDITNRHFRWFEPGELTTAGMIAPEWALLIERFSWGRMYALPARLSLPLHPHAGDDQAALILRRIAHAQETLSELSELQSVADSEPSISLEAINTALAEQYQQRRSQQLARLAEQLAEQIAGQLTTSTVQLQTEEDGSWQTTDPRAEPPGVTLYGVREVIDQPERMLQRLQPLLKQLHRWRREIDMAMHQISRLDAELADARVAVRQAELDTGRSALDRVEFIGPSLDALLATERAIQEVERVKQNASQFLSADEGLSESLRQLLTRYLEQILVPQQAAQQVDVDTWQAQLASQPLAIQRAAQNYATIWRSVSQRKEPLEQRILELEAESAGYELNVLIPTNAQALAVPVNESDALLDGQWTDGLRTQLVDMGLQPTDTAPVIKRFSEEIATLEFHSAEQGRGLLWCVARPGAEPVWLMPAQHVVSCNEIVRLFPANRLNLSDKCSIYADRWREFLLEDPREANTEGGVFPAIWGTIVMTLIMTLAVVPFGVIAALYLREYTRSGPIVSLVRISINNLAGVPSIVYGVFGLAFFCYAMGAFIDGGARNAQFGALPPGSWYAWLAVTVVLGVSAFLVSLLSGGSERGQAQWKRRLAKLAPLVWLCSLIGIGVLVFKSPFFTGFYEARLPTPTFGKEGLLWASLTLALLTLPVVIVATEEALSAVPNSLREGSLACGASKWQTIYRIVLPHARPGILTGAILAMARGVGEVAPLMLVGALPVAPDLPLDGEFPYFHGSRSFMHLGYQIYWLGFQSQNSEASKPLVFTCTLLLILIVISLNLSAILLRARLRKRFLGNQF